MGPVSMNTLLLSHAVKSYWKCTDSMLEFHNLTLGIDGSRAQSEVFLPNPPAWPGSAAAAAAGQDTLFVPKHMHYSRLFEVVKFCTDGRTH